MNPQATNILAGGLRSRGERSFSGGAMPLVTVITVVLNGRDILAGTIESVLGQSYPNLEYLVIDGGSTDGTLDIIREYQQRIDYWVSGPDRGIYHAMNRGVQMASGVWINFMNAGDRFTGADTVSTVFDRDTSRCDLIYGDHEVRYGERFTRTQRAGLPEALWQGMNFSHQSAFVRSSLLREQGFNSANRISADFEVVYRLQQEGGRFLYAGQTVATVLAGGLSDLERARSIRSHWKVVAAYGGSAKLTCYYLGRLADCLVRSAVKRLLPQGVIDLITKAK